MPKQKQDIFVPTGPAIAFSQPNQKWNILKGVTVASGQGAAIESDSFDGITLVNKGSILASFGSPGDSGVYFSSNDATIENRATGYISGREGVYLDGSASTFVLNEGGIFGSVIGVDANDADALTVENHGVVSGIETAVIVTNSGGQAGPLIENFGAMKSQNETITLEVPGATATIKNKPGGLIENTGDDSAIVVDGGLLKLNNKGTIIGGIDTDFGPDQGDHVITNSGQMLVKGEVSAIATGSGDDTVTNKGTITIDEAINAVRVGDGDDTVTNEGTINGSVNLGDSNDVYKNKGGKVDGRIDPGDGNDKLVLGNSKDRIEFDNELNGATNVNRVKNFESGKDKFFLEEAEFTGLTLGTLQKSEFTRGIDAKGDDPQLIYDKPNGLLWFYDGAGGNGKVLFAELDDDTKLKHDDFTVYA
ncbi:hypothetical protein [Bauldia sp.]|uniref:hypothetical protein n=1 Tax=Bauldia sp. TaxID=2575872 RepID=UPI003BA8F3EE